MMHKYLVLCEESPRQHAYYTLWCGGCTNLVRAEWQEPEANNHFSYNGLVATSSCILKFNSTPRVEFIASGFYFPQE